MKALVNNNDILKQKVDKTSAVNKELNEIIAEKESIIDELQVTEHKALGNNAELERELIEVKMILRKKDVLHEELSSQYQEALARVCLFMTCSNIIMCFEKRKINSCSMHVVKYLSVISEIKYCIYLYILHFRLHILRKVSRKQSC